MKHLFRFIVKSESSALTALSIIDSGGAQIALVCDSNDRLLGTLTDGDIRRALIKGGCLDDPVDSMMNSSFKYISTQDDPQKGFELMRTNGIKHLPIIDQCGTLVDLLLANEAKDFDVIPNPIVIMAGGKGTRLMPFTSNCPKPMLPINGTPILEILIKQCADNGFQNFYISVNYLKEQIIDYFGDGSKFGVNISYLIEDKPLGTAGSLKLLPTTVDKPFLILNGDVLSRLNYRHVLQFHIDHHSTATLCVRDYSIDVPFGVVQNNGYVFTGIHEKPTYKYNVNAGIYVVDPSLLSLLNINEACDMPTLIHRANQAGRTVSVCPVHEYWIDVGRPDTFKAAIADWQPLDKTD